MNGSCLSSRCRVTRNVWCAVNCAKEGRPCEEYFGAYLQDPVVLIMCMSHRMVAFEKYAMRQSGETLSIVLSVHLCTLVIHYSYTYLVGRRSHAPV